MIQQNGCEIGLPLWYFGQAGLLVIKLAIEGSRFISYRRNNRENAWLHVGGNFILMPILFSVYFGFS
jgi:hypothetical protein